MRPKQSDTAKRPRGERTAKRPPAGPASGQVENLEAKQKQRRTRSSRDEVRAASSSSHRTKGGQRGVGSTRNSLLDTRNSKSRKTRTTRDTVGKGQGVVPAASDSAHGQPPTSSGPFRINETIYSALTERIQDMVKKTDRCFVMRMVKAASTISFPPIGRIIEHCPKCETPCLIEDGSVHFSHPEIDNQTNRVKQVALLQCPHCKYSEKKILYSPYIGAMN